MIISKCTCISFWTIFIWIIFGIGLCWLAIYQYIQKHKVFGLLFPGFELFVPPVWGPQAWSRSLCTEQLHGWYWVSEKVAEAEHGTDQHSRRTSAILRHTQTHYCDKCTVKIRVYISKRYEEFTQPNIL